MSTKDAAGQNRSGTTDPLANRPLLGRDAEGGTHRLSLAGQTVFVVEDGAVAYEYDLSDRALSDWISYVRDRRGWAELYYDERPTGQWLAEALR